MQSFASNEVTIGTGLVCLLIAVIVGAGAGAIGGLKIGAADIGKEMAASMGAFFGPLAAVPGVLLALIILKLIH